MYFSEIAIYIYLILQTIFNLMMMRLFPHQNITIGSGYRIQQGTAARYILIQELCPDDHDNDDDDDSLFVAFVCLLHELR